MPGLQLMCPVCTEDFQEADDIHVTNCGHLYHFSCMEDWRTRANSCPQCRLENPNTYKVYLVLSEGNETSAPSEEDEDLHAKLESSAEKINELQALLDESELNMFHIQEQYTVEQDLRKKLEHKIAENANYEENFYQLHHQFSESEERVKLLKEDNERLIIEKEQSAEKLFLKAKELSMLQQSLNAATKAHSEAQLIDYTAQCSQYEDRLKLLQQEIKQLTLDNEYKSKDIALKIREIAALRVFRQGNTDPSNKQLTNTKCILDMEQKLKDITAQLEKEIANSTQLSIDKIILQSQIQRMELQMRGTQEAPRNEQCELVDDAAINVDDDSNKNKASVSNKTALLHTINDNELSEGTARSVVLQKFPFLELQPSLEEVIISIAAKMDVVISKGDIVKVGTIGTSAKSPKIPKQVSVYVEFASDDLKWRLLANGHLLKRDETFKAVNIAEYMDRKLHAIFLYANRKLRGVLFDYITCRNNTIIAKKTAQDADTLIIYSKEQVDELLKISNPPMKVSKPTTNATKKAPKVINEGY
ncbi:E3 ubiquitin-protein ligase TRAIP [Stomoxys calcitrans]|uniref:E3 ubiquitin-protein ligase TRAIP n=1 Tax=Stomoxys calcitrans TaxID=35570 RepID=UPI0027E2EC10|nr:E3 ubiquitin-protein ligase TRAIP [Stomoxys calcitrans]XP_059223874.1 E3 ubiquitin-protein ligase TRAIP [Stomoxys calcitrans]XP_059223875.1 E3 ubiquitin-protein ligase TRAIP [Stomoxys calcitrans]